MPGFQVGAGYYPAEIYIPYRYTAPVHPVPADVPAVAPVTVERVKDHARVDTKAEDDLIAVYLAAAVAGVEQATGQKLGQVAIDAYLPSLPAGSTLYLPWGNVQRVIEVAYRNDQGAYAEWPDNFYELQTLPARSGVRTRSGTGIYPAQPYAPDLQAVRIRYVAGYASSDEIPPPLRQAVLMMAGELYIEREMHRTQPGVIAIPNPAAQMLMSGYKIRWPS